MFIELQFMTVRKFLLVFLIFLLTGPKIFDNIILQDNKYINLSSRMKLFLTLGLLIYKSDPPQ